MSSFEDIRQPPVSSVPSQSYALPTSSLATEVAPDFSSLSLPSFKPVSAQIASLSDASIGRNVAVPVSEQIIADRYGDFGSAVWRGSMQDVHSQASNIIDTFKTLPEGDSVGQLFRGRSGNDLELQTMVFNGRPEVVAKLPSHGENPDVLFLPTTSNLNQLCENQNAFGCFSPPISENRSQTIVLPLNGLDYRNPDLSIQRTEYRGYIEHELSHYDMRKADISPGVNELFAYRAQNAVNSAAGNPLFNDDKDILAHIYDNYSPSHLVQAAEYLDGRGTKEAKLLEKEIKARVNGKD